VELAVESKPIEQNSEPRYLGPHLFDISNLNLTKSRDPSPSSSRAATAVLRSSDSKGQADVKEASFTRVPYCDPRSFELYQEYKRTGKIHYCIPDVAFEDRSKTTWQHCWSLINAYIHGSNLDDVDFADRVMDILDQQLALGVFADSETIRHVFTASSVPEQLKRFVVNRCVDAGANNFRREQMRKLPRLYVLMVLENAMERMSCVAELYSPPFVACEYHLHGEPERCYKVKDTKRKDKLRERGEKDDAMGMDDESIDAIESGRESDALVGTARAVRIMKVIARVSDSASTRRASDSSKIIGEVCIKRPDTWVPKDKMPSMGKAEDKTTSVVSSTFGKDHAQQETTTMIR
jgi:hypothetical protein